MGLWIALQVYLVFEACMRGDLYQLLVKEKPNISEHFVAHSVSKVYMQSSRAAWPGQVRSPRSTVVAPQQVMRPLLAIISSLHSLGIVHRDIKPENIFIDAAGQIQLGDFGLAVCKHYDRMTERVGTLDYMAPEVGEWGGVCIGPLGIHSTQEHNLVMQWRRFSQCQHQTRRQLGAVVTCW